MINRIADITLTNFARIAGFGYLIIFFSASNSEDTVCQEGITTKVI